MQVLDDHNDLEITMRIAEVRTYTEPHGTFKYTGYICHPAGHKSESPITYMILIRQVGSITEVLRYYLEVAGDIKECRDLILADGGEDLESSFQITMFGKDGSELPVTWVKKPAGTFFGIRFDDGDDQGIKTIAEYGTVDECGDNPHALLDWTGDFEHGWADLWVGSIIKDFELKFYNGDEL